MSSPPGPPLAGKWPRVPTASDKTTYGHTKVTHAPRFNLTAGRPTRSVPGRCMPSSRSDIAEPPEADVAVAANLDTFLDKEWEDKPLAEVLKAPVSALQGVSEGDADMLQQAFNIKTVGGLGKNKYFRAAQLLTPLAEAGAKKARSSSIGCFCEQRGGWP